MAYTFSSNKNEIEPWLLVELGAKSQAWMEELEAALFNGHNASILIKVLPPFYEALDVPDRIVRTERLRQRGIQLLIKEKKFDFALTALRALPVRQPKLEAVCQEGLGNFRSAALCYLEAGNVPEALKCYRSVPDIEAALKLVGQMGEHPAAGSLQWIARLQQLVAERPDKFAKVITAAEKKFLEELLERALGVTRRKPAPRKTVAKRPPVPRKRVPRREG